MNKTQKMEGIRANVAPWALLVLSRDRQRPFKRPFKRPLRYTHSMIGTGRGNRAARRIIPLLHPAGEHRLTCSWLQALPKTKESRMRFHRDAAAIERAVTLMRENDPPPPVEPGVHGATPTNPVLVATVRRGTIRLDLHLGKNEFESTDFEPEGLREALEAAARRHPGEALLGYENALKDDGRNTQHGKGSKLSECFQEALRHAIKTFGLRSTDGPYWTCGLVELGPFDTPTAHPLQRVFITKLIAWPP